MPQLNAEFFAPQLIWLALTFIVMYILMTKVALPRVADVLEQRQSRIEGDLNKAEKLKADALASQDAYEEQLKVAREKAQVSIRAVSEEIASEHSQKHSELSERLNAKLETAETRITKARDEALANIRQLSAEVASAAVDKLAGLKLEQEAVEGMVNKVMEERN